MSFKLQVSLPLPNAPNLSATTRLSIKSFRVVEENNPTHVSLYNISFASHAFLNMLQATRAEITALPGAF